MFDNKLDPIIRDAFRISENEPKKRAGQCPADEELADYVTSVAADQPAKESFLKHVTECDYCFARTASAVSALTGLDKNIDHQGHYGAILKAKALPKIYPKAKGGYMKRNRYLFIAAAFFILSFLSRAYFLQFLVAASIFGFKWVMDTGGSRALIMIYDTWQHRKNRESDRLFEDRDRSHF